MSQHLIKEIQQLKHEVSLLKEVHGYGEALKAVLDRVTSLEIKVEALRDDVGKLNASDVPMQHPKPMDPEETRWE